METVKVVIDADGIQVSKRKTEAKSMMSIEADIEDEKPELVKNMIAEYKPKTEIVTDIQTKIVLTDDKPIFQNPRR